MRNLCSLLLLAVVFSLGVGCLSAGGTRVRSEGIPDEHLASISDALVMGNPEEAIRAYEQSFKAAPETPATKILYARLLILSLRLDEAEKVVNEVMAKEPGNVDALFARSLIFSARGERGKQKDVLGKLLAVDPNHSEALAALGAILLAENNLAEAKIKFERAAQLDPENLAAVTGLGTVLYRERNFKEAGRWFDKAVALAPDYPFAYSDRALVKRRLGDLNGALADLQIAIGLEPDYPYNYYDRGRLLMDLGKLEEAIREFSVAVKLDPDLFIAFVMRAGLYDDLNKIDAAIADYEQVIALNKDYFYAYASLGTLYFMKDRFTEAATMFTTAFRFQPDQSEYGLLATLALKKAGKTEQAVTYLNSILPYFEKKSWEYATAQFFLTPAAEFNTVSAVNREKNRALRGRMSFYVGEQYLLLGKKAEGRTFLNEAASIPNERLIERRLAAHELR